MQYRTLGRTGVQVSTLVLGAMNFGRVGNTSQDDATAIVDAALDAGVNLIDTADMYSDGESEEIVGKAIAGRRDDVVLYVTEQPSYSILQRGVETHVLPVTEEYGMGVLAWSPLASGWLSGAVRAGREVATNRSALMPQRFDLAIPANRARLDAVERLAKVAEQAGLTIIQLALGFVTAHRAVTSAIIGPRTLDHLRSQVAAADTVLGADVLDAVDEIVAPGVDLAAHEKLDTPPSLLDPALRRR